MTNRGASDTAKTARNHAASDQAVADYRAASQRNDIDALLTTLAPDVELVSPLSGRMVFRGHADLLVLQRAIYATLSELRWHSEIGEGARRVVLGEARVGPLRLTDAMVIELAPDGKIGRIRPHLRPWLATTLLALLLAPKLARHPSVIVRALKNGKRGA